MAELIEMSFGGRLMGLWAQENYVLDESMYGRHLVNTIEQSVL